MARAPPAADAAAAQAERAQVHVHLERLAQLVDMPTAGGDVVVAHVERREGAAREQGREGEGLEPLVGGAAVDVL